MVLGLMQYVCIYRNFSSSGVSAWRWLCGRDGVVQRSWGRRENNLGTERGEYPRWLGTAQLLLCCWCCHGEETSRMYVLRSITIGVFLYSTRSIFFASGCTTAAKFFVNKRRLVIDVAPSFAQQQMLLTNNKNSPE